MTRYRKGLAYLISAVCGVAYIAVVAQLFGRILIRNPVHDWLLDKLARAGHEVGYRIAIYSHDFLIYVIVAVPFALALSFLLPRNSWRYLIVALVTSLGAQYWVPLTEPDRLASLVQLWQFWVGVGMSVLGLPIAFVVVTKLGKRVSSPATEAPSEA